MSGTCPAPAPGPTLTLVPIHPPPTVRPWPYSLSTIFSASAFETIQTLPPAPTAVLLAIATLFMTTILLLLISARSSSRYHRDTTQILQAELEEAKAKQAGYEVELEQQDEARRRSGEGKRRAVEEKRRLEEEVISLEGRLDAKDKQKALLQVGMLKLRRKAENVGKELEDAKQEAERRTNQLEALVKQAAPFLDLLRIDLNLDLPPSGSPSSGSPPIPSSSTPRRLAIEGPSQSPQATPDSDELLPTTLLTSLNACIASLSTKLADEGVRVIREVEAALDEADKWVDAMHLEEALSIEEPSELEVDSDRDRGSPRQGRRPSPQPAPRGVVDDKRPPGQVVPAAHQARTQGSGLRPTSMYFPATERRLTDSPRSLHEVELPPVGPPPSGPLPPVPPNLPPLPPPKASLIPRPVSSESRLRPPSAGPSQPRPVSAPVQPSSAKQQRATPPPSLPLSAPVQQKPSRMAPPDLQRAPPPQYMYPYPYSNQQQPMGIPVSLAKGYASARQSPSSHPLSISASTSTHRSSTPPSRSSSAASLVPFPTGISAAGAGPSSVPGAEWEKLGPYDRQVLLHSQRDQAEREKEEARSRAKEARRLAKLQARRQRVAEREERKREWEANKAEREKQREEEQGKREEAADAKVQAGEVFGEGLVGMLQGAGVRKGGFRDRVERKASTPTPKASVSRASGEGPGDGNGTGGEKGNHNGNGNGNGNGKGEGNGNGKGKAVADSKMAKPESKVDLHTTLTLAFQTALCAYTHWMMCSWFFEDERGGMGTAVAGELPEHEGGEGLEALLGEVYARVREGEEQLVSGLWRALTRKHVQRMLPGSSTSTSKRSSKDSGKDTSKGSRGSQAEESEDEDDGKSDTLIEELCIYIIDALVNALIVTGVHGGWYVEPGDAEASDEEMLSELSEEEEDLDDEEDEEEDGSEEEILRLPTQNAPSGRHLAPTGGPVSGGGDYNADSITLDSGVYHDPYAGYSISQLSEFLSVTPTADTFKIGGRRGHPRESLTPSHTSTRSPSSRQQSAQPQSSAIPTSSLPSRSSPSPSTSKHPLRPDLPRPRTRRMRSETRLQAQSESTAKYTQAHLHAHLTALFKAPLMRILKKARVLNKVLGEEVVRCDLEALYVAPGVGYVENMMERADVYGVQAVEGVDEGGRGEGDKGREKDDGGKQAVGVDVDDDGDGEDTPKPGSSPSSKQAPGQKGDGRKGGSPIAPSISSSISRGQASSSHPEPDDKEDQEKDILGDTEDRSEGEVKEDEPQVILCTTQLGLVRAEKVPRTRGDWDEVVLVKPVVVLMQEVV